MSTTPRRTRRARRALGAVTAAVLATTLLPGVAGAARNVDSTCPATIPEDGFTDTGPEGTALEEAVDCLLAYEVTSGATPTTFGSGGRVTRGQLATFVLKTLDNVTAFTRPSNPPDAFKDDDGSVHEDNIDAAAQLKIIGGFADGTFRPGGTVTRAQMATFLVNALKAGSATLPTSAPDAFDDDDSSVHEANIDILAADQIDVVDGDAAGNYDPEGVLQRQTLSFFLTRTLDVFVDQGKAKPFGTATGGSAATTTRPELVSATVTETNTATEMGPDGTSVRFTFDEEVTGTTSPVSTSFFVTDVQGDRFPGSGTPSIETGGRAVLVLFTGVATDGAAGSLTVATTDAGAVTDDEGQASPIGDAPLGMVQGSTGFTAGTTDAPDLRTVGDPRPVGTAGATEVDFTFDERAFTVNTAGFSIVLVNGTVLGCTALAGTPGGQPGNGDPGVMTITTSCPAPAAGQPAVTTANVARGVVQADTVSDDQADQATATPPLAGCDASANTPAVPACVGTTNPLEASSAPDRRTTDPDLESAVLMPNADQSTGSLDSATLTFSEPVLLGAGTAADIAARFFSYDVNGDQVAATEAARATESTKIIVRFADTVLDDAVGVSVGAGAVRAQTGDTMRTNDPDEIGVDNAAIRTSGQTPGRTNGPDLTGVTIGTGTGSNGGAQATYAFDEDIAGVVAAGATGGAGGTGRFFLLQADGTRLVCTAARVNTPANGGSEATDGTVTCTAFAFTNDAGAATTVVANESAIRQAVVGLVDDTAVVAEDGAPGNPEGAEATTGGTGTPSS